MRIAPRLSIAVMAALGLGTVPAATAQEIALPPGTIQLPPEKHVWVDAPQLMPGVQMLVLEGSPKEKGLFTMRVRIPAGTRVEPHWHPREERVTILSGMAKVGFGDTWDEAKMTTFGAGSYYLNPPESHHYVLIVAETVMQITGMGPWELHYLEH